MNQVTAEVRALNRRLPSAPSPVVPVGAEVSTADANRNEDSVTTAAKLAAIRAREVELMAEAQLAGLHQERFNEWQGGGGSANRVGSDMQGAVPIDLAFQRGQLQASRDFEASENVRLNLERQVAQLREALQQRDFELQGRPTHRVVQQLRNEIHDLKRELDPQRETLRRNADTRTLIREDKRRAGRQTSPTRATRGASHDSPLRGTRAATPRGSLEAALARASRQELEGLVASVCKNLGVTNPKDAVAATRKLATVVEEHLPPLQEFASAVLELASAPADPAVARQSAVRNALRSDATAALEKLRAWRDIAHENGGRKLYY